MSTARILTSKGLRSISAVEQSMGDLTYGTAGIAQLLQVGSGISSSVLDTLPLFSMIFAATDILKAIDESWHAPKGKTRTANAEVHGKSLIRILTSGALLTFGYESLSQTMSLGSTAFGSMCGGLAIKAAGDFTISLIDYVKAYKKFNRAILAKNSEEEETQNKVNPEYIREYEEAKKKLILNTLNFLGWGLLALAKTAGMAAIAPHLLLIGSACLVAVGLYAMKNVYDNYSAAYGQDKHEGQPSRMFALSNLFSSAAYGANTQKDRSPLSEVEEKLLVSPRL